MSSAGAVEGCPAAIPAWTCSRCPYAIEASARVAQGGGCLRALWRLLMPALIVAAVFEMRLDEAMLQCYKRIGGSQGLPSRRGGMSFRK